MVVFAAFLSIVGFSLISTAQAEALSLREITNSLLGNRQNQNNNQGSGNSRPTVVPTTPRQSPVQQQAPVTQQPIQTAPVTPVTPAPAQEPQQQAVTPRPSTATTDPTENVAVVPVDTSEDVIKTASSQSVGETSTDGTPYVSNKIDPDMAKTLLIVGIGTVTAGTLLYGSTHILFPKRVRHIPVKSL